MTSSVPRASVVVPSYNGIGHLPECLAALRAQTFRDSEIIVVDNGSTDGTAEWLRDNAADVRVCVKSENKGVGPGLNEGIRAARGEYVALLNNDTAVEPRWLEELVTALDRTGYDFAASLMVFYDRPDVVDAAGDDLDFANMVGRNRGHLGRPCDYPDPVRVLGACAGAALYRASMFRDIGLFDEDFFLVFEDVDIDLRALIAGKRCLYVPTAVVRHKHSATIAAGPAWPMVRYRTRNRMFALAKSLPAFLLPLPFVLRPWYALGRSVPRPSSGPPSASGPASARGLIRTAFALLGAEFEGFRMGLRKRRSVWSRQAVPTREIVRWLVRGVGPVER